MAANEIGKSIEINGEVRTAINIKQIFLPAAVPLGERLHFKQGLSFFFFAQHCIFKLYSINII